MNRCYPLRTAICAILGTLLLSSCDDGAKPQAGGEAPPHSAAKFVRSHDKNALARGANVFLANCAVCHGANGEAKPGWQTPAPDGKFPPPPLDDSGRAWRLDSATIKQFIRTGSPHGRGNMPPWQGKLSDREIDDVVVFITSLWSNRVYLEWHANVERPA